MDKVNIGMQEKEVRRTCFQALQVKVEAAALVGLTQVVTPASWGLHLFQLKAPPLAGAGRAVVF